jgi:hypothetical protein
MRPSEIPAALNGQPFRTADARALGMSLKTLQGSRFPRLARGVYESRNYPRIEMGSPRPSTARVDLVYIAYKLIIEYEGDQHRTDRNQWNRDIDRQEDFARDNWMLIRVTSERAR